MPQASGTRSLRDRIKRSAVWLTLLPVLLSMWMIYEFSAQPADQSNETSGRLVALVIRLFVPDFDRLDAVRQADLSGLITLIVRKLAHATEFAVLGFFLHLHTTAWHQRLGGTGAERRLRIPWWIWSLPVGIVYAVTDELHQGFVADRAPRVADVGVDTAGVIAGMAACGLVVTIVRRLRHKGKSTA